MTHSVRTRGKKERARRELNKRVTGLRVLAKRHDAEVIKLSHISLGELRKAWRQSPTDLRAELVERMSGFQRIKVPKGRRRLVIQGSDGGLLAYCCHIDDKEMINRYNDVTGGILTDRLYESIQELPKPENYMYRGRRRSEYIVWHFCVWAKYSLLPFLSREYRRHIKEAERFFEINKELFKKMSGILGQGAPGVFKDFLNYPLPNGLKRLCDAWLGCVVNNGGNSPNHINIHRDASEALYGYSGMVSCGDFKKGGLILYELEIILEVEAGDFVIFQDAIIHHSNEKGVGNRCSVVAFSQENVYSYWNRKYKMELRRKELRGGKS